jgi:FkbM family methyltransferase
MKNIKSLIHSFFVALKLKYPYYRALFLLKRIAGVKTKDYYTLKKFYSGFVEKGNLVYDVGANIGNRTEVFLSLGANVVCIEPNPELCKTLKSRFGSSVKILNIGLGAQEGFFNFNISSNHYLSSFSEKFIDHKTNINRQIKYEKSVPVQIKRMDSLIEKYGVPDFVKIDTEGYEREVVLGLSVPVKWISFEFTLPVFQNETAECIRKLMSLGYSKFNIVIADNLVFELPEWVKGGELNHIITTEKSYLKNTYGDIYAQI